MPKSKGQPVAVAPSQVPSTRVRITSKREPTACEEEVPEGATNFIWTIVKGVKTKFFADLNCECKTCGQKFGTIDRDSKNGDYLKWSKTNTIKGKRKATGNECYPCQFARIKHQIPSQQELLEDKESLESVLASRAASVRGDDVIKAMQLGKLAASVEEKKANFSEDFGEGYFYKVKDYLKMIEPELDCESWSEKQVVLYMQKTTRTQTSSLTDMEYWALKNLIYRREQLISFEKERWPRTPSSSTRASQRTRTLLLQRTTT